jgi:probable HAF family extracellular repeat protein
VTGEATTTDGATHAFLYDGTMHDLGTLLGGTSSYGRGINDSDQVTGYSQTTGGVSHAFLYDGTMHDLGTLGGPSSHGRGINASGQVTGDAWTTPFFRHAFLYDGTMHDLGTLGGTYSEGWGINDSGQVTGYSTTTGNAAQHAFLYDGTMHDLGTLGGTLSVGYGINASGQVTGYSYTTWAGGYHAFLYDSVSLMVDLNSLIDPLSGWVLLYGEGINDAGQITGHGTIGGETHAFLLTPVPEPSTLVLAALGILGLLAFRKRRRSICAALMLSAMLLSAADARAAPMYHVTDLGTLGGTYSYGYGINASVSALDENAARLNGTNPTTALKYLNLSGTPAAPDADGGDEVSPLAAGDSGVASALTASAASTSEVNTPEIGKILIKADQFALRAVAEPMSSALSVVQTESIQSPKGLDTRASRHARNQVFADASWFETIDDDLLTQLAEAVSLGRTRTDRRFRESDAM